MDSAENPWFLNWANDVIQIIISLVTQPVWAISSILCMKDCWWANIMKMGLFPPGVTSWNVVKNKGMRTYGDADFESEIDYETFYNEREDAEGSAPS